MPKDNSLTWRNYYSLSTFHRSFIMCAFRISFEKLSKCTDLFTGLMDGLLQELCFQNRRVKVTCVHPYFIACRNDLPLKFDLRQVRFMLRHSVIRKLNYGNSYEIQSEVNHTFLPPPGKIQYPVTHAEAVRRLPPGVLHISDSWHKDLKNVLVVIRISIYLTLSERCTLQHHHTDKFLFLWSLQCSLSAYSGIVHSYPTATLLVNSIRYQHIETWKIILWRMYCSLSAYWNMEHLSLTDVLLLISILKHGTSFSDGCTVRYQHPSFSDECTVRYQHIERWNIFLWRMHCSLSAY
jgi:hypothetical protein